MCFFDAYFPLWEGMCTMKKKGIETENPGNEMNAILEQWKKRKRRMKILGRLLVVLIFASGLGMGIFEYYYLYNSLPSVLRIKTGELQVLDFGLPMTGEIISVSESGKSNVPEEIRLDLSKEVELQIWESKDYLMDVKLFGCFPFKKMDIQVIGDMELIPAGIPVGLYVETDGLMVIGVGEFEGEAGIHYSPSKYILKSGDYILECNGEAVTDKDSFIQTVEECEGKEIKLKIQRNHTVHHVSVQPEKNQAGEYKIGVWIRDNAQGVGTLTYVDANGKFGALGHGVTDVDTSMLMEVEDGTLYQTEIISIKKGRVGTPGEMTGMIVYSEERILGDIEYNGKEGIFGVCNEDAMKLCKEKPLPIGLKQEIKEGPAQIYCTLEDTPCYYNVEITHVQMDHDNVNRGIELQVTDLGLLEKTGGIVQGMSGSPIIQDGKIIGAVTHVLVNDPTKGYGIFIENMLEH